MTGDKQVGRVWRVAFNGGHKSLVWRSVGRTREEEISMVFISGYYCLLSHLLHMIPPTSCYALQLILARHRPEFHSKPTNQLQLLETPSHGVG